MTHIQQINHGSVESNQWRIETVADASGLRTTRWHTQATRLPDGFLLLFQVAQGSANTGGTLLAGVASWSYRHFLDRAQIDPAELPNWNQAAPLDRSDEILSGCYATRTSAPEHAGAWLLSDRSNALVDWAMRHPIENFRPVGQGETMLYAIVGPGGLWLCCTPALDAQPQQEELTQLGLRLARSSAFSPSPSMQTQGSLCPSCGGPGLQPLGDGTVLCSYCGNRFAAPAEHGRVLPGTGWVARRLPSGLSTMAVISLVSGILGMTLIPVLGSLVAVGVGVQALREIRSSSGRLTGGWLAAIGVILGVLPLLFLLLVICLFIAAAVGSQGGG
jgi:hypothetical protein